VLAGMRSVLGLVGLVGGAATVILAVVSFLAKGSFSDFLYRAGIAYLLSSAAALAFVIAREASRPSRTAEAAEQSLPEVMEKMAVAVLGMLLSTAILVGALALLAWITGWTGFSRHESIELLGGVGILSLVIAVFEGWDEIVGFAHKSSRSFRPCPRCGKPVEAGVMECPHCQFDFWSIGREAD
jgi:hypothetical protein